MNASKFKLLSTILLGVILISTQVVNEIIGLLKAGAWTPADTWTVILTFLVAFGQWLGRSPDDAAQRAAVEQGQSSQT